MRLKSARSTTARAASAVRKGIPGRLFYPHGNEKRSEIFYERNFRFSPRCAEGARWMKNRISKDSIGLSVQYENVRASPSLMISWVNTEWNFFSSGFENLSNWKMRQQARNVCNTYVTYSCNDKLYISHHLSNILKYSRRHRRYS